MSSNSGQQRPVDSGRRDSLGRRVMVGEGGVDSRASAPSPMDEGSSYDDWRRGEFEADCAESAEKAMDAVRDVFGELAGVDGWRRDVRGEVVELIEEAHTPDDPDWQFNSGRLCEEIVSVCSSRIDRSVSDLSDDERDRLEAKLDELFPLQSR